MITIRYDDKKGKAYTDSGMHTFINYIQVLIDKDTTKHITIANELIFLGIRAAISQGKIPHDKIIFEYIRDDGIVEHMYINKHGRFLGREPKGFCPNLDNFLDILFFAGNEKPQG
jgi:hypothetical protein